MPYRERRDLDLTLQCVRCGAEFHPFKRVEQSYCSRACATAFWQERMAALRAEGHDPAHGGAVAEKRRQALARRCAGGEHFGRKAPADGMPNPGNTDAERVEPPHPRVQSAPPDL